MGGSRSYNLTQGRGWEGRGEEGREGEGSKLDKTDHALYDSFIFNILSRQIYRDIKYICSHLSLGKGRSRDKENEE
jgi:hypothetical protein